MIRRLVQGKIVGRVHLPSVKVPCHPRGYGPLHPQDGEVHSRTSVDILSQQFHSTLQEYWRALELANKGLEFHQGPWMVAKDIPRIVYDSWVVTVPGVWKISYEEQEGAVLLYGDPSRPHGRTATWFWTEMVKEIQTLYGWTAVRMLAANHQEDFSIPGYGVKVPDLAVVNSTSKGLPPNLVIEVGYRNERSLKDVVNEVALWESFGVPIIIGCKITDNLVSASMVNPRMQFILRIKGYQDELFHLGQGARVPCVGRGTHVMKFPARLLLPAVKGVSKDVCIDLFDLQQKIRDWVL